MAIVTKYAPTWKKVTFYYNNEFSDSDLTFSLTNSADIVNSYDYNQKAYWLVDAAQTTASIELRPVSGDTPEQTVDYLALGWHTLGTNSVDITFAYSDDGATYTDILTSSPTDDSTLIFDFASVTDVRFRLSLSFASGVRPRIGFLSWGEKTELDYNLVGFEPNARRIVSEKHINDLGYYSAKASRYTERTCVLDFDDIDGSVYTGITDWYNTVRSKPFFVGWENEAHSSDSFIMRSNKNKLFSQLGLNGRRKSAQIKLIGVA